MCKRHTLPRLWLMTDERMGDRLLPSILAMPRGSGIVFRHYSLTSHDRALLFAQVKTAARRRRHVVVVAGHQRFRGDGVHGRQAKPHQLIKTAPVHSVRDVIAAQRGGADLLFVSPVFATRSHQGDKGLGRVHFGLMVRHATAPVIALGGLTRTRAASLSPFRIYGWAAIDALMR